MRFADGTSANVEEVIPAPAIRADAERALTDGLARLPGPPIPRPRLRYFLSYTPGVVGGWHRAGDPTLWVGIAQIGSGSATRNGPAEIGRVVRHELGHEYMDRRELRPATLADEEAAAEAFAEGDAWPLRVLLVSQQVAERLIAYRKPSAVFGVKAPQ